MNNTATGFAEQMKRNVQRWRADLAATDAKNVPGLSATIRQWIGVGEYLIEAFKK